jgi:hypothetical protein
VERLIKLTLIAAMLSGCSAFDYLQYREDTGLMAVEKPDGYGSSKFGEVMAVSSTSDSDLLAVAAGEGHQTVIYEVALKGSIGKMQNPNDQYPANLDMSERSPGDRGSGASLAGLPLWMDSKGNPMTGCFAVGEPGANHVSVTCASQSDRYLDLTPPEGVSAKSFGLFMASVRPFQGSQWLLAVAGERRFGLFSSPNDTRGHSVMPEGPFPTGETISGLAAGRVLDPGSAGEASVIYLAVATATASGRHKVYIFMQTEPLSADLQRVGCLEMPSEVGFGGAMTTGDLDGDGMDELVVSSGLVVGRSNNVHVFDGMVFAEQYLAGPSIDAPGSCTTTVSPMVTLTPQEGEYDIECRGECSFGTSLAIGDVATDDSGPELAIGARDADVEGEKGAGAVYIYRGWQRSAPAAGARYDQVRLAGQVIDSAPVSGNELGASVAIGPVAGRNELFIGAAGTGKILVAFCTGVGRNIETGGDVTRDGDDKVVSTRCRL